ncbi:MAG TPA: hypothetical protein VNY24_02790 [Candidatus Acidoferrales bacterium]|jgi:hypothetical protein|nr:hypothetical protein [Candidatus Acidoferrales bacterium]
MPNQHPKVPATSANCEEDHKAKLKLNEEFAEFKKRVENAAMKSPDVKQLIVPLEKLEKAMIVAAHGKHLIAVEDEQKRQS